MDAQTSGSKEAARIMLNALMEGSEENVRSTLARLDTFFPTGSPVCEFEKREVLESVGEEAVRHWDENTLARAEARLACFELLAHIAGRETGRSRAAGYLH